MMDVCQAVTGLTPEFGYLIDERRRGQLLVRLDVQRMGAAMASSGAVTMYHVVGVKPEAPDVATAFGGRPPPETVAITQADLDGVRASRELQEAATVVVFGCPQMTLEEATETGRHLVGKRVRKCVLMHMVHAAFAQFEKTDLYRQVVGAGVEVWQHCPLAGLSLRIGLGRGRGRSPAMVTRQPINFTAAMTKVPNMLPSRRAEIRDRHHELYRRNTAGRVLVSPACIGSTHTGLVLLELVARGAGPAGLLVQSGDSLLMSGVIPIVEYPGTDLFERIADGTVVELDGTSVTVTIEP